MISFVVPAHDEARLIARTLETLAAIGRALGQRFEIVVADDASTDDTASIARACGARVVSVQCRQIAGARNAGARAAVGEVLIFVDADTIVPIETVRAALAALATGAAGGGVDVYIDGRLPVYARVLMPMFRVIMRLRGWAAGCFLFCTRAAFDAAGGFDERLFASEEIALSKALAKHGRFIILRERVLTSGRKLRTHSGWDVLKVLGHLVSSGGSVLRSRDRLSIWYGARRDDV